MINIIEALSKGIVTIEYTSLISGNTKKIRGTLQDQDYLLIQNPNNDKLVMWDIDRQKWEDIQKDTIISWSNTDE
tara:strand:- start:5036 stop:5260 length:225 start_codon:yes stop_codon:yes gene_type:complete